MLNEKYQFWLKIYNSSGNQHVPEGFKKQNSSLLGCIAA